MKKSICDKTVFYALKGKKVLFVTTKNLDYLRNTQEIAYLEEQAESLTIIGSMEKKYPKRLLYVYRKLLQISVNKFDAVFVGFSPQLVIPFWNWKLKRAKLYIDFFISMYDTLAFDRKKVKPFSVFGKILRAIDRKTLKKADVILADTKAHAEYFADELGAEREKLHVLYLKADETIYYPHEVAKPKEAQGKFTVFYFGSILPLQGVEVILKAIQLLKDRDDICFYIVGPIKENAVYPKNANIHYISWLSQSDLSDYIAFSDLCLAGHFNGEINKAKRTIPGKAYIYHAMGKPMILGENLANHELFEETEPGIYFVPMSNPEKLAQKILEIAVETLGGEKALL